MDKSKLPPTYLFLSILIMVVLHFLIPCGNGNFFSLESSGNYPTAIRVIHTSLIKPYSNLSIFKITYFLLFSITLSVCLETS